MILAFARLVTKDVLELAEFYRQVLRVEPMGSEDYAQLNINGSGLALSSQRSIDLFNAGAANTNANRSLVLDFQVEDVDAERERLQPIIAELVMEPTDQPWGTRSMLFRDPDGTLINFFAPVSPLEHRLVAIKAKM
jgi:uncharacterized glyoxalase superfamily protein PhnB